MSRRHVSRHQSKPGDTPQSVARQYGLSSARALTDAPDNGSLAALGADAELPVGSLIAVPPNAIELTKERIYLLDRIRPQVHAHFFAQQRLLERDVLALAEPVDGQNQAEVEATLEALRTDLEATFAALAAAALPLMDINTALMTTHVHGAVMGRGGEIRELGHSGLAWLCGIEIYTPWLDLWSVELWQSRWTGVPWAEAVQATGVYFNLIRSRVVQEIDARLRESQAVIAALMRESNA